VVALAVCTETVVTFKLTATAVEAAIVTCAVAVFELSACATAVTVTVAGVGAVAGAVYMPVASIVPCAESPPATPFTCQLTVLFEDPLTKAVNFCVAEGCREALSGLSEIVTPCGLGLLDLTFAHSQQYCQRRKVP